MKQTEFWKNFNLGEELTISGAFVYNGLRKFHEMRMLDNTDEIFEVLYSISVGLERLLKIATVLVEHSEATDQASLEESLITHSHLDLLERVRKKATINLGTQHNEFLQLLGVFYKTLRYGRFAVSSVADSDREKNALHWYLAKHLDIDLKATPEVFGTPNEERYRRFIARIVTKIARELYEVIKLNAIKQNLYTYELRSGSKAETIFLRGGDRQAGDIFWSEDVLWKELLVFFMNTESNSGIIEVMRKIEPLEFDPGLAQDYLDCFGSNEAKALVIDELEALYEGLDSCKERLEQIERIANPYVDFDDDELDDEADSG